MWGVAVSILCVTAITTLASAEDFPVVDGERQATIVFSQEAVNPPEKPWPFMIGPDNPHKELAEYIEKTTGRRLAAVSESELKPGEAQFPIYVGNCQITQDVLGEQIEELDRDGYMIVVEPTRVFLVGPQWLSTYWAVGQFLQNYLGVRWLIPGALGEDVIPQERIVVSPTKIVETPKILSRKWYGVVCDGSCEWSLRHRVALWEYGGYPLRHRYHHNLYNIFDPDKYYDEHPEYYPILAGKRFRPEHGSAGGWQPCMTEPGTVPVAAQAARDYFEQHPEQESFAFGVNDGGGYCECPNCLAWASVEGGWGGYPAACASYSRLYYSWLSRVAKELEKTYPDKLLGCLAYSLVLAPPDGVELDRSILPYITFTIADMYAPRYRDSARRLVEKWAEKVDQIGFYDYAYGMGFVVPRLYTHVLQDTLRHGIEHNLAGVCAEVDPNWGLDAPRYYLTAALWWNPDVNIDALFDEWNERMFREAAEPMKKYFARCEQAWVSYQGYEQWPSDFDIFMRTPQLEVYTPEVIEECTGYLDEAARLATGELVKERVRFFRKTWQDVTLLFANAYWPNQTIRRLIENDEPIQLMANALQQLPKTMPLHEFQKEINKRIGNDQLAFYPRAARDKGHWLPIPGTCRSFLGQNLCVTSAADKTYQWCVARLTPAALERARAARMLHARTVQQMVEKRIRDVFPPGGSAAYQKAVADIHTMATKVVGVARAASAPRIDGVLNDEVWPEASELSGFVVRGSSLAIPQCPTTARLAYDDENLYMGVECSRQVGRSEPPPIAGDVTFPQKWCVFAPLDRDEPVLPRKILTTIPDEIEVAGHKLNAQFVTSTDSKFDFAPLFGGTSVGRTAYAFLELKALDAGQVTLGMGADWWMQAWLDGNLIYDTPEATGNVEWPICISNHLVNINLTKGRHVLAVRFISGKASSVLALGGPNELRTVPRAAWIKPARELVVRTRPSQRDASMDFEDYVALIIRSAQYPQTWAHLRVNPAGALFDEWNDGYGPEPHYNFDCEWAAQVYPDRWTVELRLPLAQIKLFPATDPVVRMNLVRNIGAVSDRDWEYEVSTWYPEPLRGPHWDLANQGWLILE